MFRSAAPNLLMSLMHETFATPLGHMEGDNLVLEIETPGFGRDDLSVEVIGHTLLVQGKIEREGREPRSLRRSYALPRFLDIDATSVTLENGLLRIEIPRFEKPAPRALPIT